jgi:hypothetical protein
MSTIKQVDRQLRLLRVRKLARDLEAEAEARILDAAVNNSTPDESLASATLGDYWTDGVAEVAATQARCSHFHVKRDSTTSPDFICLECGKTLSALEALLRFD